MNVMSPAACGARVLFVAPSAYPLGGVQVWLDYVLAGLRDAGWQVALALTAGRFHNVDRYLARHPFEPVYVVSAPTGTQSGRINALRDRFVAANPDIIVGVNIADVYLAAAAARGASGKDIRVVASLHGLQPDFLADLKAYGETIDGVICTNQLARRLVVAHAGLPPDRVFYAPYGVEREAPLGETARQGSSLRLGFVGRLENEQKRLDDLIDIVAHARGEGLEVELLVAGAGPDEAAMRRRVGEKGLVSCVRFFGVLSPCEAREKIYRQCDALVITSHWETGPIVAWEAMINNVAVLTSAYVGSGAEGGLIDGVNCLMFPVGDVAAAVAKLRALFCDETRARLRDGGQNLVRERYTIEQSVAQWSTQLMAVLRAPTRPWSCPPTIRQSGRLDRLFGVRWGEAIRRLSAREHPHLDPGGEWPHAYGRGAMSDADFWLEAGRLDSECQVAQF